MSKVKLAISGCMGRMGQQLVKSSRIDKSFKLTALTENRLIKKKIAGIIPSLNHKNSFKNVDGILVPGGFGDRGIEGKIISATYARENNIPFFGKSGIPLMWSFKSIIILPVLLPSSILTILLFVMIIQKLQY